MNKKECLTNVFQLQDFRPGQERVIDAILEGRSALAVFPTGAGKSLCYQLPSVLLEGLTLVVSPLIALMKDQVDALKRVGVNAAKLDSTLSKDELAHLYLDLENGAVKILFVSPERLKNTRFTQKISKIKISLLAVDEAHCISEWGHNFRPEYLTVAAAAGSLKVERILALTATATPAVAQDICKQFKIDKNDFVQTSFERPNLILNVRSCQPASRFEGLLDSLKKIGPNAPSIVYVTLQKTAEEVAGKLRERGINVDCYHAGLKDNERSLIQDKFMNGEIQTVVATIAFGMGIDKNNIRAVFHYNLPKSIESYVQEIGRSGRDGGDSWCEMFPLEEDVVSLENFTYGDTPSEESIFSLVDLLKVKPEVFDVSSYELSTQLDLRPSVLATALTYLQLMGSITQETPFSSEYKVTLVLPLDEVLAKFDENRKHFLEQCFNAARKTKNGWTFEPEKISTQINEPRVRIVAALEYLESQELVHTEVAGIRQVFKNNWLLASEEKWRVSCDQLVEMFQTREKRDLERLNSVLLFAKTEQCLSQQVLWYFGEKSNQGCGRCSFCRGEGAAKIDPYLSPSVSEQQFDVLRQLISENHPALSHPRQIARYLCGLPSPALTRSPLRKLSLYGSMAKYRFPQVLEAASQVVLQN